MDNPITSFTYDIDCPECHGSGQLPGRNWISTTWVLPTCFHCAGTGRRPVKVLCFQGEPFEARLAS